MSRITVHHDDPSEDVEVWLDTEVADRDGICIGVGQTKAQALVNARYELKRGLARIRRLLAVTS